MKCIPSFDELINCQEVITTKKGWFHDFKDAITLANTELSWLWFRTAVVCLFMHLHTCTWTVVGIPQLFTVTLVRYSLVLLCQGMRQGTPRAQQNVIIPWVSFNHVSQYIESKTEAAQAFPPSLVCRKKYLLEKKKLRHLLWAAEHPHVLLAGLEILILGIIIKQRQGHGFWSLQGSSL